MSDSSEVAQINTQHLQALYKPFAAATNLTLVVTHDRTTFELPVHADILSAYSPVLHDMLKQRGGTRLTMRDDDKPAVCAALARMYAPFFPSSGGPRNELFPKDVSLPPLILLADKYNMLSLLEEVESALVSQLDPSSESQVGAPGGLAKSDVVDIAVIAEGCQLKDMLTQCEAYFARNFDDVPLQQIMAQKLSAESCIRVARGLSFCHEFDSKSKHLAVMNLEHEAQKAISSAIGGNLSCPREGCHSLLNTHNASRRSSSITCSNAGCSWPREIMHGTLSQKHIINRAKRQSALLAFLKG